MLEQVRSKVGKDKSDTTNSAAQESASAAWTMSGGNPTGISSTLDTHSYDQKEYIKKLEQSVSWLEDKLQTARKDFKALKKENTNLKDSNENHIFINDKLNKALKKSEARIEHLTQRVK